MQNVPSRVVLSVAFSSLASLVSLVGCGSSSSANTDNPDGGGKVQLVQPKALPKALPKQNREQWFSDTTVSLRGSMHVPAASELFALPALAAQQLVFDPGASLHCQVEQDPAYQAAVDAVGGVEWGYAVSVLEDQSQPRIISGFYAPQPALAEAAGDGAAAVEIAEADIVGVSDQAALYYTPGHGLVLVDLTGSAPKLSCAAQLPGQVKKFYLYNGHLVALVESWPSAGAHHAYLFHLKVIGTALSFVENVDLGDVSILDSRRFNDQLVVYGAFSLSGSGTTGVNGGSSGGASTAGAIAQGPAYYGGTAPHRSLQVFKIGAQLTPAMHDTLLDTHTNADYVFTAVDSTTKVGAQVNREESFGESLYASDHYFVVTQAVHKTFFDGFQTQTYQVCTKSHTVDRTYRSCSTQYVTKPNPDYTPPDTKGGDRSCNGQTLRDCLQYVAKVSNPTIEVPVSIKCVDSKYADWICDSYQTRQTEYPTFHGENETKLFIYAYTDTGFVRLSDQASTLAPTLQGSAPDTTVASVSTGSATHELLIPGSVQTLQFQNGYLYAIADEQLLTFAVNGSSLVQTSSVTGTSATLQTSLFTSDKLYLSDYSPSYYTGVDPSSVLRVFDLSNPAFPVQASTDRSLPGGHDVILPVREGIFTIGRVDSFQNTNRAFLKLGLFSDPFTAEKSYAILGTDLSAPSTTAGMEKSYYFDSAQERLFLPYSGTDLVDAEHFLSRVDVSAVMSDKIVPNGGIDLPETPERVRAIPGAADSVLTFAPDSIELLSPDKTTWKASDVFAYFRPVALYRLDDSDRYAELLKLGNKCKLRVTAKAHINELNDAQKNPTFDCYGLPSAYGHNLLFTQTQGVSFDDAGQVQPLTVSEVTDLYAAIEARPTCVLDPTITSNAVVDYTAKHDLSKAQCFTPEQLQAAQTKAEQTPAASGG